MKVFVYFNLHKKCFSIKALEGEQKGRVIIHAESAGLLNVTFKVSEAGRQRVLREKRKNVHAGVVGDLISYRLDVNQPPIKVGQSFDSWEDCKPIAVSYNPYRAGSFFDITNGAPVDSALAVGMSVHNAKPTMTAMVTSDRAG